MCDGGRRLNTSSSDRPRADVDMEANHSDVFGYHEEDRSVVSLLRRRREPQRRFSRKAESDPRRDTSRPFDL